MLQPPRRGSKRTYNHVPLRETDDEHETSTTSMTTTTTTSSTLYHDNNDDDGVDVDDAQPERPTTLSQHRFEPLEVAASIRDMEELSSIRREANVDEDGIYIEDVDHALFHWSHPWPLSIGITVFLSVPTLLGSMWILYHLTGRIWTATLFSLHLALTLWTARFSIPNGSDARGFFKQIQSQSRQRSCGISCCVSYVASALDMFLFGVVYTTLFQALAQIFFTEPDGTTVIEWTTLKRHMIFLRVGSILVVLARCTLGIVAWSTWCWERYYHSPHDDSNTSSYLSCPRWLGTCLQTWEQSSCSSSNWYWTEQGKVQLRLGLRRLCSLLQLMAFILATWCVYSVIVHWFDWPSTLSSTSFAASTNNVMCDARDSTECCLPFPSFHHMQRDPTTVTGWRVHLRGTELPPLRGHVHLDPTFLNQLDGFSTMAPLLFYMEGLKEAYEQQQERQQQQARGNVHRTNATATTTPTAQLQGHPYLAESVTNRSITLLLDVQARQLVHHSAEIDYLDPDNPLVLVFPAAPLKHNAHYALAVVNAVDQFGIKLTPTVGMQTLLSSTSSGDDNSEDHVRFRDAVLPSLTTAAPWFSLSKDSLQLLFDFQTISAESQLGPVRAVRDATLRYVQSSTSSWGNWSDHVRVIRKYDNNCHSNGTLIARTIHAILDVPWFLNGYGPGFRNAVLDDAAVASGQPTTIGQAKFVVHVPCSLRAAALNETYHNQAGVELRAVMEYGHGLFFTRAEASDHFLWRMAHEQGYIIMAMDWRGMSAFDLPIVTKTLMSTPRLFQAVRDNLIQGYANKFALQHFAQNGMLSMDWLHFRAGFRRAVPIPTYQGRTPTFVFYGISQGGILGAGYSALSGPTGLIARSILGVPGTPFALIMSRSLDFAGYDQILLRNFYSNRHVRILLSLVQMAWDSVEGSGVLAPPLTEPFPRMLLQAGLGDAVVPTLAAEALARAFGASILPHNPIQPFGLPISSPANETWDGPNVTLTELLYQPEYKSLPQSDVYAKRNEVHVCVRRDRKLILQITEFINTGRVIDSCALDGCVRKRARCFGRNLTDEVYN